MPSMYLRPEAFIGQTRGEAAALRLANMGQGIGNRGVEAFQRAQERQLRQIIPVVGIQAVETSAATAEP